MAATSRSPGVLDTNFATESIILVGWVLNVPIDASKVQAAWAALIAAWPVLVARLSYDRMTKRWDYHIPVAPIPGASFASMAISDSIHNHYEYSIPSQKIHCSEKSSPLHLYIPYGPRSMKDLVNTDRPVAHLHVTTFQDGALVGLAVPHIVCDAGGVAAIARALEALINGGQPPAPLDPADPFESYVLKKEVPAPPNWRLVNILETLIVYARAVWTQLFGPSMENRDVFFPEAEVTRIKTEAMEDIRREHGANTDLWVSSSDAILAFCLKCAHCGTRSSAPLNVFYTANIRKLFNLPTSFLHNSVSYIVTDALPVSSISTHSLGALALHIRKMIETQTTKSAAERWLQWRLTNVGKLQICFDPWRGQWQIATNWREMKLLGVDFSGALPDADIDTKQVKCEYMWMDGLGPVLRNWIGLIADDPSGGLWMAGTFSRDVWEDKRGFGMFITD